MMITVKSDLTQIFCYTKCSKICASFAITKCKYLRYFKTNYVASSKTKKAVRFSCSLRTPVNKPLGGIFIQYIKNFTSFFYYSPRHFLTNQNPYYYCIDHLEAYN